MTFRSWVVDKGIIESGVVDPDLLGDAEDGNGREIVKAMLAELGLEEKDVDQLETLPYDQLAQAYENAAPKVAQKGEYVGNHPHKNQSYFGDAIKHGFRGETKKIPLLIGTVRKFRSLFIISIRFRCAIAVRKQIGCRNRSVRHG